MSSSAKPSDNEDKKASHSNKKGRDIKPLHEAELKKKLAKDREEAQKNADILAELAAKTAELAEQVKGPESPKARVLNLEGSEPRDIFEEMEEKDLEIESAHPKSAPGANPAADLIRQKLNKLYQTEPDATQEAAEAVSISSKRSKHQQFMYDLTTSGNSLADIQTKWHEYYIALPDDEKHEVWQEFYKNQHTMSMYSQKTTVKKPAISVVKEAPKTRKQTRSLQPKNVEDIKTQLLNKVNANGRLKPVHHIKSALFGIGLASVVGLAITFVFFNEVFVAPFISPSKTVSATPIVGEFSGSVGNDPKIIIPKINLEVPVVYDLNTIEEKAIQDGLENGVVHYSTTPNPGEIGNVVIVGHSSNNILNSGKYKFAFVLLKRLEAGDTLFVQKDGVRYTYKVFEKKIVPPTDISVLGPSSKDNTITLITCDPPGTSINRLIIVAEQISPDPATNTKPETEFVPTETQELPSNAPSMWSRFTGWL